jgi:transcriptional regulator with XRE-family HTH domain
MAHFVLKKVLEQKGWSQYRLARELGVSAGEVHRWVKEDYNPTLKTLSRIADVMDVRIEELIEHDKRKPRL